MKKIILGIGICALALIVISASVRNPKLELTKDFIYGNPEITSISSLSFGPEGILFIGDSKSAAIYALDTKDNQKKAQPSSQF